MEEDIRVTFDSTEDVSTSLDIGTIQYGRLNIGETITGSAGDKASVTNTGSSVNAILNFTIPKGDKGEKGDKGDKGIDGVNGIDGKNGVDGKSATISVGTTTSGNNAKVTNSGSGNDAVLDFVLPIPKTIANEKGNTIKTEIYPNTTYQPINLTLDGRSTQETKSGNLFKGLYTTNLFINLSSNYYQNANNVFGAIMEVKPNTTYTIKRNGGNRFALAESNLYPAANVACNLIIYGEGNENEYTFTTKNDTNYIFFYYSNENANVEITLTTENTPSPDYPSEIESVGYTNLFSSEMELGSILGTGELQENADAIRTKDFVRIEPNTQYYLTNDKGYALNLYFYDENKTYVSYGTTNNKSFTAPSNAYYFKTRTQAATLQNDLTVKYILSKTPITFDYVPYGKYGIKVESSSKNLYNATLEKVVVNGLTRYADTKQIYLDGTPTAENRYLLGGTELPIGTYTLCLELDKGTMSSIGFYLYKNNSWTTIASLQLNSSNNYKNYIEFTLEEPTVINLGAYMGTYQNCKNAYINYQIVRGQNADYNFQPYQKSTSLIVLNEPLRSLPNGAKDIAYLKDNKLYVDRYVKSVVLNGSEDWGRGSSGWYIEGSKPTFSDKKSGSYDFYCDNFKANNNGTAWTEKNYCGFTSANVFWIRDDFTFAVTIDGFKTWLSTHNTEVIYELATPTTEEYGYSDFQFVKGENNITNNFDTYMTIEYYNELKGDSGLSVAEVQRMIEEAINNLKAN